MQKRTRIIQIIISVWTIIKQFQPSIKRAYQRRDISEKEAHILIAKVILRENPFKSV